MAALYNKLSVNSISSQYFPSSVSNGTYNITVSNNTSVVVTVFIYDSSVASRWFFAGILAPGETAERKGIVIANTTLMAAQSSYASAGNTVDILINGLTA